MKIFNLPDLGEGLAEAEIHEWYVNEGDTVKADMPMVSLETAKAVVDVPAPWSGKISKLYGKVGDIIQTDSPLVAFESDKIDDSPRDNGTVVGSLEESNTVLDAGDMLIGTQKSVTTIKAMPVVRTLARQLNVDLSALKGTGSQGQITIDDVKKASTTVNTPPLFQKDKPLGNVEPLQGVRRVMAMAMTQSHQEIVPVTLFEDADLTDLPIDCDITVKVIQAIVAGVQAEPSLNAWYDGKNLERCLMQEINLGLAVDTRDGLFVPVLKNIAAQSPTELRLAVDNFKKSVRERTVIPSELQGATLTSAIVLFEKENFISFSSPILFKASAKLPPFQEKLMVFSRFYSENLFTNCEFSDWF